MTQPIVKTTPAEHIETGTLLTVSASGTTNGNDFINYNNRGAMFFINLTLTGGTAPTATFTVQGKDPVSGQYYTILATTALNATGFTALTVYPGAAVTANVSASTPLPRTFRIICVTGGTIGTIAATVGACLIP